MLRARVTAEAVQVQIAYAVQDIVAIAEQATINTKLHIFKVKKKAAAAPDESQGFRGVISKWRTPVSQKLLVAPEEN